MTQSIVPVKSIPRLPHRPAESHKGTFGRVLILAGSRGMAGAAILCGSAALRGGAGLVQVVCPFDVQPTVALGNPCYTTVGVCHRTDGTYSEACLEEVTTLAEGASALAIGPGLGQRPDVGHMVRGLLATVTSRPIVLDADGLNVLSPIPASFSSRSAPLIITPHPGEFARLIGKTIPEVQANRDTLAVEFATTHRCIVVLKGHRTVVTDGKRIYHNDTGNPGMATGGSGDVLTGLLAALLAAGLDALDASVLGVWIHGRAGDLAAGQMSRTSLIAGDLLTFLPQVFLELEVA